MCRSVLVAVLLTGGLTGCSGEPTPAAVGAAPAGPVVTSPVTVASEPPAGAAAPTSPVAVTSAAPPADAARSARRPQVVELSTEAVAGVAVGTAAGEAEQRLRTAMGQPTQTGQLPGCNGETGRRLAWGELLVFLAGEGGAEPVLSGWSVERDDRYEYRLPFGTRLGETAAATERRVPGAAGSAVEEGPYAGSYVVTSADRPELLWIAAGATAHDPIDQVAFIAATCD